MESSNRQDALKELQEKTEYHFNDSRLLRQALTHSSYSNEQKYNRLPDYERLEFLGDAVLEMVSSAYIFRTYNDASEGEMTRTRAAFVCEEALSKCAARIGLPDYILLGRGEEATGGRKRDSIIADVMEALIGAIYIDGGVDEAAAFINRFVLNDLENRHVTNDSKSTLQELVQGAAAGNVRYELLNETGPEHDKTFETAVYLNDAIIGQGSGHTKKASQQQAATRALKAIDDGKVVL